MTIFQQLMILLAILKVGDWLTTILAIKSGHGVESNRSMNRFRDWLYRQGHDGRWLWINMSSLAAIVLALAGAWFVTDEQATGVNVLAGAVCALYCYAISINYRIYLGNAGI